MIQKWVVSMVQPSDFQQVFFSEKSCLDGTTRFSKKFSTYGFLFINLGFNSAQTQHCNFFAFFKFFTLLLGKNEKISVIFGKKRENKEFPTFSAPQFFLLRLKAFRGLKVTVPSRGSI